MIITFTIYYLLIFNKNYILLYNIFIIQNKENLNIKRTFLKYKFIYKELLKNRKIVNSKN